MPFSAGHAINGALHNAKDAILVNLGGMNDIQLSDDGNRATIGPGSKVKKIINELWAQGKQTGM